MNTYQIDLLSEDALLLLQGIYLIYDPGSSDRAWLEKMEQLLDHLTSGVDPHTVRLSTYDCGKMDVILVAVKSEVEGMIRSARLRAHSENDFHILVGYERRKSAVLSLQQLFSNLHHQK